MWCTLTEMDRSKTFLLHRRAARAYLTAKFEDLHEAIVAAALYAAVMEFATPETWPAMYGEAHSAWEDTQLMIAHMHQLDD